VRILADTSDTRDSLKLFLWQAERHATIPSVDVGEDVGVRVGVVECELYQTRYTGVGMQVDTTA